MTAYVFSSMVDATSFSASMDARLGYPKAGVNIGPGLHASIAEGTTLRHGEVVQHPTLMAWRYPDDGPVKTEIGKGLVLPITATEQTLDATWFPVGP
jgi:hypothetical protein